MKKHILIVDDSPSVRQMVELTLKMADHDVTSAVDGVQALKFCASNHYDLIVTDQNMPNMDGLQLIKKVRALDDYKQTPIIMLTTESSNAMKAKGRSVGATGWMVKPFDPEKLLYVTSKVLSG
jgi:two-component system, chemotaxis family, chemotaxis protein CheY